MTNKTLWQTHTDSLGKQGDKSLAYAVELHIFYSNQFKCCFLTEEPVTFESKYKHFLFR